MSPIQKYIIWSVTLLMILAATTAYCGQWVLYFDKPIKGWVIEADTGKSIKGAIVVVYWKLSEFLSEGPSGYAKTMVVESGPDGKFTIPAWMNFKPWKFFSSTDDLSPYIVIFKPGYFIHTSHSKDRDGFEDEYSMTEKEKAINTERTSITPAKLIKITTNKERWENLRAFKSEAKFTQTYSYFDSRKIDTVYEEELGNLPIGFTPYSSVKVQRKKPETNFDPSVKRPYRYNSNSK